jgi:hypothetical protein
MPDQRPTKKPTLYCLTLKDYGQYILSHLCEGYNPRTCMPHMSFKGPISLLAIRAANVLFLPRICQKSAAPLVTEESQSDRSKSDAFTKTFAILQSTWLIVQSIARASAGLPITELELVTMAYVLCAVIMNAFW